METNNETAPWGSKSNTTSRKSSGPLPPVLARGNTYPPSPFQSPGSINKRSALANTMLISRVQPHYSTTREVVIHVGR